MAKNRSESYKGTPESKGIAEPCSMREDGGSPSKRASGLAASRRNGNDRGILAPAALSGHTVQTRYSTMSTTAPPKATLAVGPATLWSRYA